jgi:hypothetical protein
MRYPPLSCCFQLGRPRRRLFVWTITITPSSPDPQIEKLAKKNGKKKNATVWPIPVLASITHLISFFFALILNRTRWTKAPGWLVGRVSYNKYVSGISFTSISLALPCPTASSGVFISWRSFFVLVGDC